MDFGTKTLVSNMDSWKIGIINDVAKKYGFEIDWENTNIEKHQLSFLGEPENVGDQILKFFAELQEKLNIEIE